MKERSLSIFSFTWYTTWIVHNQFIIAYYHPLKSYTRMPNCGVLILVDSKFARIYFYRYRSLWKTASWLHYAEWDPIYIAPCVMCLILMFFSVNMWKRVKKWFSLSILNIVDWCHIFGTNLLSLSVQHQKYRRMGIATSYQTCSRWDSSFAQSSTTGNRSSKPTITPCCTWSRSNL